MKLHPPSPSLLLSPEADTATLRPVTTWMGDCSRAGKQSGYITSHLGRLSLLLSVGWDDTHFTIPQRVEG